MNRRNRTKRRIMRLAVFGVILILLLLVFFLFQVRQVDVYGNTRHSSDEIAAGLSDSILTRNTLFLAWKYREGDIPDTMPYLDSLHVQMKSPSRIEVQVTEKEAVAYVENNGYIYIDGSGMILEISDELYGNVPLVTGLTLGEATLYQKLPTESSAQLETIRSIVQLLADQELEATEIRFGDNMEITVFIQGVEAQMGQNEYLPEKVANLSKILPRLDGQQGVLHLEGFTGGNEAVTFSPSGETGETSADGDGTSEDGQAGNGDDQTDGSSAAEGGDTSAGDGAVSDGTSSGDSIGDAAAGDGTGDASPDGGADGDSSGEDDASSSSTIPMVFDSSGTLVYNVHIENGVVVDSNGTPVSGVTVNEDGNVVDAYMNVIDPATGELVQ